VSSEIKVTAMRQFLWGTLSAGGLIGLALFPQFHPLAALSQQRAASVPGNPEPTTIVHLFEWTWNDIAAECEAFLGPQGYKAVQISPPQEHAVFPQWGYPWWQRYQPVSYQLESRSGSRKELVDMVQQCRAAGVEVYADAVINHMAGVDQGLGSAGTAFTKYDYPGLYSAQDFNTCRQPVKDYGNADDVTQCELVGLADLDTSSDYVQARIVAYLQDLASIGITGFRIDAAKHIRFTELRQILEQFDREQSKDIYIFQEVIDPGTEAIRKQDYYASGDVVDFEYGRLVGAAFLQIDDLNISQLKSLGESWGLAPSSEAVVFIDNHDKQRGHGGGGTYLTHQDGDLYTLANVFMLAFPYGQTRVMSSYAFEDSEQGPPTIENGTTRPVYDNGEPVCFDDWVCEHRWTPIANMVMFRNITQPQFTVTDWWSNGGDQIAFGRGDLGFVVINRRDQPLSTTFQSQLPAGDYCNVLEGALAPGGNGCENQATVISVDGDGRFITTINAMEAIAIHAGARLQN
jgi:alpha-amylase